MLYRYLLLLIMTGSVACNQQDQSRVKRSVGLPPTSVDTLVRQIAAENKVDEQHTGFSGEESAQWRRFEQLAHTATKAELTNLTTHSNGAVRCYAFRALVLRRTPNLFAILRQHLNDTQQVRTQNGCLGYATAVGDYMLETIQEDSTCLSRHHQAQLDSLLRFDPAIQLEAARDWLTTQKPDPRTYQRVRELAADNRNPFRAQEAVVALAAYRRPEDRVFIARLLNDVDTDKEYYGLWAAKRFPDPSFFPRIQAIHQAELRKKTGFNYGMLRQLYQAIVQYRDKPSRQLLLATLALPKGSTRTYHLQFVWLALQKYPAAAYNDLKVDPHLPDYEKANMLRGDS